MPRSHDTVSWPASAAAKLVLTCSPMRSGSGCASRMPRSSVTTTKSAPVRACTAPAAAASGPPRNSSTAGAAAFAEYPATAARTSGSSERVRAIAERLALGLACAAAARRARRRRRGIPRRPPRRIRAPAAASSRRTARRPPSVSPRVFAGLPSTVRPDVGSAPARTPRAQCAEPGQCAQRRAMRDTPRQRHPVRSVPVPVPARQRSRHARHTRIRHDPRLHGADHDQAADADGRPHRRSHHLRPVRRRGARHRRHGARVDRRRSRPPRPC